MSELISKEALRIAVLDTDWNDDTDADVALDMIDNAHTVEERKHGHWIKVNRCFGSDLLRCSNCKKSVLKNYSPAFCEYCGAIMDEVSEDE